MRCMIFFFKQKTAYEMRISDWSSDVSSSDLQAKVSIGGPAEIDAAARAAVAGQKAWQDLGPERRRDCLLRLADLIEADAPQLLQMAALECGTPLSSNSSGLALSWIRYYDGLADKIEGTGSAPPGLPGLSSRRHVRRGVSGVT